MEPSVLSRSRMMGKKTVNSRRIMAAVMVIVMLAALTGCVGKEDTQTRKKNKVVEIPMILTVDSSTGNKNEEEVVERFNRAYKGKYHIDVDWVMETEEEYRKNLKRMNVTDELPAIITDLRMLPSFYQMMIKKGWWLSYGKTAAVCPRSARTGHTGMVRSTYLRSAGAGTDLFVFLPHHSGGWTLYGAHPDPRR